MKHAFTIATSILLITFAVGCGDSYDKVGADILSNVQAVRDALKSVKDVQSAQLAGEKVKTLAIEMAQIQVRFDKLGKPSKEEGDALNTKYQTQIKEAKTDIQAERQRITALGPEVLAPIEAAMMGGK